MNNIYAQQNKLKTENNTRCIPQYNAHTLANVIVTMLVRIYWPTVYGGHFSFMKPPEKQVSKNSVSLFPSVMFHSCFKNESE